MKELRTTVKEHMIAAFNMMRKIAGKAAAQVQHFINYIDRLERLERQNYIDLLEQQNECPEQQNSLFKKLVAIGLKCLPTLDYYHLIVVYNSNLTVVHYLKSVAKRPIRHFLRIEMRGDIERERRLIADNFARSIEESCTRILDDAASLYVSHVNRYERFLVYIEESHYIINHIILELQLKSRLWYII